ncbi:MAG: hypothetical protein V5A72_00975 [Candidatus Nanohaloarchaea archaeon]
MKNYKWSDNHFGLAGINAGMVAFNALDGNPGIAALNAGLFPLNMGLALKGREEEVAKLKKEAPEKALGSVYDATLKDQVSEAEYGRQTSGRRVC